MSRYVKKKRTTFRHTTEEKRRAERAARILSRERRADVTVSDIVREATLREVDAIIARDEQAAPAVGSPSA